MKLRIDNLFFLDQRALVMRCGIRDPVSLLHDGLTRGYVVGFDINMNPLAMLGLIGTFLVDTFLRQAHEAADRYANDDSQDQAHEN